MSAPRQRLSTVKSRPAAAFRPDSRGAYRGIGLTMIVSFAVTCAFLLWKQRASEAPLRLSAPVTIPQPAHSLTTPPARAAEAAESRAPMAVPSAETAGSAGTETSAAARSELVPVTVRMRNFRHEGRVEGSIQSLSPKPLNVAIEGSDRQGGQVGELTISLAPFETKPFGSDQGLDLKPGDLLRVQSQGYREQEVEVR